MSLSIVFSESDIKNLLNTFSEDSKYQIIEYLEDIVIELKGKRNILGIYEFDNEVRYDEIKEEITNTVAEKMHKLIRTFNIDMLLLLNNAEAEFRQKLKDTK